MIAHKINLCIHGGTCEGHGKIVRSKVTNESATGYFWRMHAKEKEIQLPVLFSQKKDCIILNSFCVSSENEKNVHHCEFLICSFR